ncbi:protein phosphatase 1 regulatory subunit 1A-like [Rhincodon typus]|uniref:protein phosphatase 1 regulatory subunit 1A-like n=1 Tax=Rhincodon typus TaxID=259920 RepID=UPI002030BD25|nr:protein phosphatase 1 regulatory subunit 1A-like [Rhincodon typus]XP_048472936.1 protein phosphatase 1 regulatory subunit 1A-like [Rhincodon typus]
MSRTADWKMDSDSQRIKFEEPTLDLGLDPQMAEQIRRRRPTPAILMIPHQQFSGISDEKKTTVCQVQPSKVSSHKEKQRSFPISDTMTEIQESEPGDDEPDTANCTGNQRGARSLGENSLSLQRGQDTA